MAEAEIRLRRTFVALYGSQRGREATAEALAYGWEHWAKVRRMANPTGYLFRVGQSRTRSRKTPVVFTRPEDKDPWCEPALDNALSTLSDRQRIAVVLVHGFGWTMHEVAELTGIKVTTVQTHLNRGLAHLRAALEVTDRV